ncbi:hypothetical protein [Natrialba aegyptia]|uniref:Phage PhiH1 repressor protein n=1 Tax=Natrialba aegyptia DSM 13077 TaxID=1227491 RepID=M0BH02_9EURY|nr:hypothetical protein [Natrialba aegyptia]ELZ09553.1 hypothetical protein C480_02173 [Natrialba aegyptia DSM 13077]
MTVDADSDTESDAEPDTEVPADWMDPADEPILELMSQDEFFMPDQMEDEKICRSPHAAYRCRELTKRDLLTKHAPGMYDITELGEQFLAGEVDPTEISGPEAEESETGDDNTDEGEGEETNETDETTAE